MKVTCQKCGAAYAINEAAIPPKGARAQCPRCKHLQAVNRPEPEAPAPAPDLGREVDFSAQASPDADPFANLDLGSVAETTAPEPAPETPEAASADAIGKCRMCGKYLFDAFDGALGTCEACRAESQVAPSPPPTEDAAAKSVPKPLPRIPKISEAGAGPSSEADARSTGSRPLVVQPTPLAGAPAAKLEARPTFRPPRRSGGRKAALGLLLLLALGAGAASYLKPAFLFPPKKVAPALPAALRAKLTDWKLAHPALAGTPEQHLDRAKEHMAFDRPADYRVAEEEYKQAALLAGENRPLLAHAVAGAVEAHVVARGEFFDRGDDADVAKLLDAADSLAPHLDIVHRARAYLLIQEGGPAQIEQARKEARAAFDAAPPTRKAEALLAQGCAFLDSAQIAYDYLDQALKADPALRRAYYYRGLAAERVGHYAQALSDLEKRLALDPEAQRSLLEIARIDATVGETAQAKKALVRLGRGDAPSPEGQLLLAEIAYQVDGRPQVAEAAIKGLLGAEVKPRGPVLLAALVSGAALARERGELPLAQARLAEALQVEPASAPALFQKVVLGLATKSAADLASTLQALVAKAPEGLRIDALRGRVAFAQDRPDEGVAAFRAALDKDPEDLRAALLGAALAAKAGKSDAAYQLMAKAMDIDPQREARHRGLTEFYESARSELGQTAGGFEKDDQGLALPIAYAGVLHYHRQDFAGAEQRFNAALKIDPNCVPALLYLAQLSLDRKKYPKAIDLAQKALDSERLSALGRYILAQAKEAQGSDEEARRQLGELITEAPGFTGAMLRQGQLLAKLGKANEARDVLLKVFFADPEDTEARQALFRLGY